MPHPEHNSTGILSADHAGANQLSRNNDRSAQSLLAENGDAWKILACDGQVLDVKGALADLLGVGIVYIQAFVVVAVDRYTVRCFFYRPVARCWSWPVARLCVEALRSACSAWYRCNVSWSFLPWPVGRSPCVPARWSVSCWRRVRCRRTATCVYWSRSRPWSRAAWQQAPVRWSWLNSCAAWKNGAPDQTMAAWFMPGWYLSRAQGYPVVLLFDTALIVM